MAMFDSKIFNAEVFGKYINTIPTARNTVLLETGVFAPHNEWITMFPDQSGGNFATVPMYGRIGGNQQNYDGNTDIIATSTETYSRSVVAYGRAQAWEERDFSNDITGADFMGNIARQIAEHQDYNRQKTILSILKGIFGGSNDFVTYHTYDISSLESPNCSATTLNSALQRASGDMKDIFKVIVMHSAVATNLENLKLLEYLKYTDSKGITYDLTMGLWNGRRVFITDEVPVNTVTVSAGTQGVYTVSVGTALADGDTVTITAGSTGAKSYEYSSTDNTASKQATSIAALFANDTQFTVAASGSSITFTQKSNGIGLSPVIGSDDLTTGSVTVATTTAGVAPTTALNYVSYIFGTGAFETCDLNVSVPYEIDRDPFSKGGKNSLIVRERHIYAPYGFSFTKASMSSLSPTNEEFEIAANWELVSNCKSDGSKVYIPHKVIPISRIISRG